MCKLYFAAICENLLFIHLKYKMNNKTRHTYIRRYIMSGDIIIMNASCNQHPDNKCTYIQIGPSRVNIWKYCKGKYMYKVAQYHILQLPRYIVSYLQNIHSLTDGDLPGFWLQVHVSGTKSHTAQCHILQLPHCIFGAKNVVHWSQKWLPWYQIFTLETRQLPLKYCQIFTLEIFECMCICCLDVDCMNVYMIIMSPDDSPHESYCLYIAYCHPQCFDRKRKHNVINHITMLKHHYYDSKYCFVLDLKYIFVLILLEREL